MLILCQKCLNSINTPEASKALIHLLGISYEGYPISVRQDNPGEVILELEELGFISTFEDEQEFMTIKFNEIHTIIGGNRLFCNDLDYHLHKRI